VPSTAALAATWRNGDAAESLNSYCVHSTSSWRHRFSAASQRRPHQGRYEVLDHLGGGNFGSVYRVRDEAVGNVLACKEMHVLNDPDTPGDERLAALDPFKREALNLARCAIRTFPPPISSRKMASGASARVVVWTSAARRFVRRTARRCFR
jgi:hypothetical protein